MSKAWHIILLPVLILLAGCAKRPSSGAVQPDEVKHEVVLPPELQPLLGKWQLVRQINPALDVPCTVEFEFVADGTAVMRVSHAKWPFEPVIGRFSVQGRTLRIDWQSTPEFEACMWEVMVQELNADSLVLLGRNSGPGVSEYLRLR